MERFQSFISQLSLNYNFIVSAFPAISKSYLSLLSVSSTIPNHLFS